MLEILLTCAGRPDQLIRTQRDSVVIGRSPGADLSLEDGRVGRIHACIEQVGSRVLVFDLGSTNGTAIVSGELVTPVLPPLPGQLEVGQSALVGGWRLTLQGSNLVWDAPQPVGAEFGALSSSLERRLVLGDWLEQQGRPREAEYVRAAVAAHADAVAESRLRLATRWVPLEFRAHVSWSPLNGCAFGSSCPADWSALPAGAHPMRRECSTCQKTAFFCATVGEARHRRTIRNDVVAVDPSEVRAPGDLR